MSTVFFKFVKDYINETPKQASISVTILLFALDYVLSFTYKPWWDILLFTIASTHVFIFSISISLTTPLEILNLSLSIFLCLIKLIYLLNYIISTGNIAPFIAGAMFGILFAAVPSFIEKWNSISQGIENLQGATTSLTTFANIFMNSISSLSSEQPKIDNNTKKVPKKRVKHTTAIPTVTSLLNDTSSSNEEDSSSNEELNADDVDAIKNDIY